MYKCSTPNFHLLPGENSPYCESRLVPKFQRTTTKLITVSHINKVFQSRCKDFQDCITAFRPLLTPAYLIVTCLYKVISGSRWPEVSILFYCILLPHHAPSMHELHLLRMQSKHSPPPSNYIMCVHTFCNHEQKQFLSYFPSDLQANNFNAWSWEPPLTTRNPQESPYTYALAQSMH